MKKISMRSPLLDTDQIRCYAASGMPVPCPGSGQDAAQPKRSPWDASRFQIQGDVVRDGCTGVVWSRNANPANFPLSWDEAQAFVHEMSAHGLHGYAAWRLPPRWAIFSLLSHQQTTPALPEGHPFANVFSGYYWTADACARLPGYIWHVHVGGGRVPHAGPRDASLVWPVCLPVQAPVPRLVPRFHPCGDMVADARTDLCWNRDADPAGGPLTWEQALEWVEQRNRAAVDGLGDWRMPNIRELESLTDLAVHSPALPSGHPFRNIRDAYWSSTTSVYEPRYAWTLYVRDGMVGVGFKPDAQFHLWPVRGGERETRQEKRISIL